MDMYREYGSATRTNRGTPKPQIKALTNTRATYQEIANSPSAKRARTKPILSYLRLEASLQQSSQTVTWNVLATQSNTGNQTTPTELRLQLNDSFTMLQLGFFIEKIGSTATYSSLTAANFATGQLGTFPDPKVFTGSGEAANLRALYNGNLNLTIIDKVVIKNFPMLKFYRVPQAQQTIAFYTGGPAQVAGWENPNYGLIDFTPAITIEGSQNIQFTCNVPASVDTSGTSSSNVAVLFLYGFLLQNGAGYNR